MGMKMLAGLALSAIFTANVGAAVVTDDFSGPSLDTSLWTVGDNAGSYNTGGSAYQSGGLYTLENTMVEGASNIRASLGNVGANDTVRVDAIVYTGQYGNGRWSMKTALYFDNENWIGLKLGYSGGEDGVDRIGMISGGTYTDLDANATSNWSLPWNFVILSVELTPTEVRFYSSAPGTSHGGATDIDANVQLLPLMTIPRPASYTGNAYAVIGKGYANASGHGAYLNHNGSTSVSDANNYITYARLTLVPEPASLGLLVAGALSLMGRRRSIR
jgi:hypothetical protein